MHVQLFSIDVNLKNIIYIYIWLLGFYSKLLVYNFIKYDDHKFSGGFNIIISYNFSLYTPYIGGNYSY